MVDPQDPEIDADLMKIPELNLAEAGNVQRTDRLFTSADSVGAAWQVPHPTAHKGRVEHLLAGRVLVELSRECDVATCSSDCSDGSTATRA